jgi:hypothetical protein
MYVLLSMLTHFSHLCGKRLNEALNYINRQHQQRWYQLLIQTVNPKGILSDMATAETCRSQYTE